MNGSAPASDIELDPAAVAEMIATTPQLQLIDVREPYERDAGYIAGSRHIELAQLPEHAAELEQQRPVVFYCRAGSRSLMAAQALRASGYQAFSMAGGLLRWAQEGRALEPEGGYVAEH